MIGFDFDWSDLLSQILLALAVLLLGMQFYWLVFRKGFGKRPALRIGLNVLLWLSVSGFLLKPFWAGEGNVQSALLVAESVPASFVKQVADSLHVPERVDLADLEHASFDTLVLVGQDFGGELESKMVMLPAPPFIQWVPYFREGNVSGLNWKGILRKGEMQVVRGTIEVATDARIKIGYAGRSLDSVALKPGKADFKLQFPVFAEGRNAVELLADDKVVDTLQFFARPAEPLHVRFLLNSPDFESRNLATWLGKNGHAVQYDAALSKDLKANININKAADPDLIITDPGNAGNAAVKKAVAAGKSVLFFNLTNPAAELAAINRALDTRFSVRRISDDETVRISPELNALPYAFSTASNQERAAGYPVLVEKMAGSVAVSLLTETFPVQLAGDSLAYDKIWNAILAVARPILINNVEINAPVQVNVPISVQINGFAKLPELINWAKDSLFLRSSLINPKAAKGQYIPRNAGWTKLADSLEVFVEEKTAMADMSGFFQNYQTYYNALRGKTPDQQFTGAFRKFVPDWFWYTLLLLCFAALWVEEKLSGGNTF